MKISLERERLLTQLQTVSRVASTRSAIQALSGVQLSAAESGCELRATDMDVGLRVPLEAEVTREGTVVLPARLIVDVVRSLPADAVSLELRPAEQDVELVSGNATFHIRTLRGEDFPPFPEPDDGATVELAAGAFVSTALKVAGSASRDETRPVLTGILVSASERELRMVATDSYRLSVKETTLEAPLTCGLRGQRAGPGAAGAGASGDARRRRAASRQRAAEPGAVHARARDPLVAADRRPVPELPPAAARELRARAAARRRRVHGRRAADQPAGAEERAVTAGVRAR